MRKLIYVAPEKLERIEHRRRAEGKPYSLGELISESGGDLNSAVRNCIVALSLRERQVVRLLLKGTAVKEIVRKLKVSGANIYEIRANAIRKIKIALQKTGDLSV